MEERVRIGIIGTGVFGNYHANKCAENLRVDFVGVYDLDASCAAATGQKHDVSVFETYEEMLSVVDAVIISCTAKHHGALAAQALEAGRHCLIEKPIAATLDEAQKILDLSQGQTAQGQQLIVQTGHQERFVAHAIGLPGVPERPIAIRAFRMGSYSTRGTDVSVTLDLMSHDLDLVLWLMGSFPHEVTGQTEAVHAQCADIASATLTFENGTAELTASRASDTPKRMMEIEYPSGTVRIDFNAKTLVHDTPFDLNIDFAANPIASDSLGASVMSFVNSITRGAPVVITAQDGYDALRLALMIDAAGDI